MKISKCTDRPLLSTCELENFNYQVDPYIGCEHYCYYCYVLNKAETDWQNMQHILEKHYSAKKPKIEEIIFSKDHSYWNRLREELLEIKQIQQLDLRIHV
jgi:DNA repair photolyase